MHWPQGSSLPCSSAQNLPAPGSKVVQGLGTSASSGGLVGMPSPAPLRHAESEPAFLHGLRVPTCLGRSSSFRFCLCHLSKGLLR